MTLWRAPFAAVLSAALMTGCGLGRAPQRTLVQTDADTVMVLKDPRIAESSGLAASAAHPGVFYTHNDKGSAPQVFAVTGDGTVEAVIDLPGAPSLDWEDMAVTLPGNVWIGDIGAGDGPGRSEVAVIWFREPAKLADGEVDWLSFRLAYEDGPHDAEALLVDPRDRRKYVVTKDAEGGGIYAAPARLKQGAVNPLERIADAPPNITGGSFAPDGGAFALRNSTTAYIYTALDDPDPVVVTLPQSAQGESILFLENGDLLVGSEGASSAVIRVPLPSEDAAG